MMDFEKNKNPSAFKYQAKASEAQSLSLWQAKEFPVICELLRELISEAVAMEHRYGENSEVKTIPKNNGELQRETDRRFKKALNAIFINNVFALPERRGPKKIDEDYLTKQIAIEHGKTGQSISKLVEENFDSKEAVNKHSTYVRILKKVQNYKLLMIQPSPTYKPAKPLAPDEYDQLVTLGDYDDTVSDELRLIRKWIGKYQKALNSIDGTSNVIEKVED